MSLVELLLATTWVIIPVAAIIAGVLVQRFKTQERLRLIERGIPLPPEPLLRGPWDRRDLSPSETAAHFRLAGTICIAVGVGLFGLFTTLAETEPAFPRGVIAVAGIPFCLGAGFLIEYRTRRREQLERDRSNASSIQPGA